MKKLIQIAISLLWMLSGYSQNDTLYLKCDHIVLNGNILNKINPEGKKEGEWMEYDFTESRYNIIDIMGSGDNVHFYGTLYYEYRPLSNDEHYGMHKMTSYQVDTIDGVQYIHHVEIELRNKIPPEYYYISSKGRYQNNEKEGKWNYFYISGTLIKSIVYQNGLPIKSFKIYNENKKIKAKIKRNNETTWTAIQYSPEGRKFRKITNEITHFKMLY